MPVMNINSPGLDKAVVDAANRTGTPPFVLAGMYESGFNGDPLSLANTLKYWHGVSGGTRWQDALAAYHAGSVKGVLDPAAQNYARAVISSSQQAPQSLLGAMPIGDAFTLAGLEVTAGIGSIIGAAGAAAADAAAVNVATGVGGATEAAATGGAAATAGAGGAAGGAASKLAGKVTGSAATSGLLAGLGGLSDWQEILKRALTALVGIALLMLGLQALTGIGDGNPVTAVRKVAP